MEQTCRRVFWVCSINAYAWRHLAAVRPDLAVFRHRQTLPSWSEDEIRALIRARTAASGVELAYDDLMIERMEGVSAQASLLQTEEGYTRLLWGYSDGNPRVALHFWLRSLVPEAEGRFRVRLFRAPSPSQIEEVGETALFLLSSVVLHENLSLEDAVEATRYPAAVCPIHLDRFLEEGVLRSEGDCHRATTRWHRVAARLLERRNLLLGTA